MNKFSCICDIISYPNINFFMRLHFKFISTLSFVFFLITTACQKGNDSTTSTPNPTPTSSGFSFKVDGNLITADSANASIYTSGGARRIDVYVYKGKNVWNTDAGEVLEMHFAPKSGSQNVSALGNDAWLTYFIHDTTYYDCSSGHFNLTTCDTIGNKLEGTFDFVGTSSGLTKNITEGKIIVTKILK